MSRPLPPPFPGRADAEPADLLIAHRGVPARHPEQTAAALLAARDGGARAVELDVRPTADGLLVVLHDESPRRLTGDRRAASARPAEELLAQRCRAAPGEALLLLDEALALLVGRVVVDIEVKPDRSRPPRELAEMTLATLIRAGSPPDVIVTSESAEVLEHLRDRAPRLPTGLVHRSTDRRDPVVIAREVAASVIVANRRRVDRGLVERARGAGLDVWAYLVYAPEQARELAALGCRGLFTDDLPRLADRLRPPGERRPPEPDGPRLLVIDLGSSSTKVALVGPAAGVIRRAAAPTPTLRPATGRVEHPPRELLGVVLGLLEQVAAAGGPAPVAAAIASQRSTALWTTRELAPVSAAVSWRDRRGEAVVARLEPERDRLEAAAGLPLAPAWSGILGRALVDEGLDPADHLLLPLGAFVAARLTGSPPVVDPTLANRTFLLGAGAAGWSAELAGALELPLAALPPLAPTVHPYGELRWPGGGTVPLLAVAGDQQCAYVGAAGPTGRRLVANVGTAAFVMRLATAAETIPPQARQGPLWTSARRPRGPGRLVELPVLAPEDELAAASPAGADDSARAVARAVAMGDQRPASFAAAVAAAARRLRGAPDQALLLAGGALASPQLVHLVETALDLPLFRAGEPELTLIGAARLAAAGARLPWAYAAAGGARGSSS